MNLKSSSTIAKAKYYQDGSFRYEDYLPDLDGTGGLE